MNNMRIALTGEMRSGKDEVGKYLIEWHEFKRLAFGDGIKAICQELFPYEFKNGAKPRKLLQDFGQFCVGIDEDVWVNYLFNSLKHTDLGVNMVVTDLRQPHEYNRLLEAGFTIIRVNTDPGIRRTRMAKAGEVVSEALFNHETERHVRGFEADYELYNNGTLGDLYQQIDVILNDMAGGEF